MELQLIELTADPGALVAFGGFLKKAIKGLKSAAKSYFSGGGWIGAGAGMLADGLFSAKSSQRDRSFASRAHQTNVADLRAAGLNPILSAHGTGASAPASQGASIAQSGKQLGMMKQEIRNLKKQEQLLDQQNDESFARENKEWSEKKNLDALKLTNLYLADRYNQEVTNMQTENAIRMTQMPRAKLDEDFFNSAVGKTYYYLDKGLTTGKGVKDFFTPKFTPSNWNKGGRRR